jgi:hypothetical protein
LLKSTCSGSAERELHRGTPYGSHVWIQRVFNWQCYLKRPTPGKATALEQSQSDFAAVTSVSGSIVPKDKQVGFGNETAAFTRKAVSADLILQVKVSASTVVLSSNTG